MQRWAGVVVAALLGAGCVSSAAGRTSVGTTTAAAPAVSTTVAAPPSSSVTATSTTATPTTATPTTSTTVEATPVATGGCAQPAPPPVDRSTVLTSGGELRSALVHVPPGYRAGRPAGLLVDLHGIGGTAREIQAEHGFERLTDPAGVVVVYPQGLQLDYGLTGWVTTTRTEGEVDDIGFLADLLDALDRQLCLDHDRIWLTGHSFGGALADYAACELTARVTAVAVVSGAFLPRPACEPARAVPMLFVHGLADEVAPYGGKPFYAPVEEWVGEWATRSGCDPAPPEPEPLAIGVEERSWSGCDAPLELTTLEGAGHPWDPRTAELVWGFLTDPAGQ